MGVYYFCTGKKDACKGERTGYIYTEELFSGRHFKTYQTLPYFTTNQW